MKHDNNSDCPKCDQIIALFPGFHPALRLWFKSLQYQYPEAHVSCAGRGEISQEELYARGATKAKWMKSAHNYNCALDLFCLVHGAPTIYPKDWFVNVVRPKVPYWLNWYGAEGSAFFELPHVEVKDWKQLLMKGEVRLVGIKY